MPTKWARITINIPPELGAALKHLARNDRRSVASYVAMLVENHIATADPLLVAEERAKLDELREKHAIAADEKQTPYVVIKSNPTIHAGQSTHVPQQDATKARPERGKKKSA